MSDQTLDNVVNRLLGKAGPAETGPLVVHHNETFELTISELLAIADRNPGHPNSTVFRKAVAGRPLPERVVVEKVDIMAIIENKTVVPIYTTEVQQVDGVPITVQVRRKALGQPLPSSYDSE